VAVARDNLGVDRHDTSPTLIERLRDPADRAAWERFESTYSELVVRYCRAKGLQVADAEDTWQLTLVKLVGSIAKFKYDRTRGRFRDYLFVVVRSVLANEAHRLGSSAGVMTIRIASDEGTSDETVSHGCGDEAWEREWRDFHFRHAWKTISRDFEPQSLAAFE